jgi:hypothetical protein
MKLVEAKDINGGSLVFWLKQGWSDTRNYSAIQFGMFQDVSEPALLPDSVFVDYVAARTERAKSRGATHILMVHMVDSIIQNYVVLKIDDVTEAYRRQIQHWPARARNTKTPTLYFEDSRRLPDAISITAVTDLEIPLETTSGLSLEREQASAGLGVKKVSAQIERRLQQQKFRVLIGEKFGWRCMVSGTSIREVLDAAHLPGRDWRHHNEPTDGILIRADLHRLLDQGLAEVRGGKFWITASARKGEYAAYHGRVLKY